VPERVIHARDHHSPVIKDDPVCREVLQFLEVPRNVGVMTLRRACANRVLAAHDFEFHMVRRTGELNVKRLRNARLCDSDDGRFSGRVLRRKEKRRDNAITHRVRVGVAVRVVLRPVTKERSLFTAEDQA
jgi:hypothetical protein